MKRRRGVRAAAETWARHHRRMQTDENYARLITNTLVAAAWQETLTHVSQVGLRALIHVIRTRSPRL